MEEEEEEVKSHKLILPDPEANPGCIQPVFVHVPVEAQVKQEIFENENLPFSQFTFPNLTDAGPVQLRGQPSFQPELEMEIKVEHTEDWDAPVLELVESIKPEYNDPIDPRVEEAIPEANSEEDEWGEDVENGMDSDYSPNAVDNDEQDSDYEPNEPIKTRKSDRAGSPPCNSKSTPITSNSGIVRPNRCQLCTSSFQRRSGLKVHMRKRHNQSLDVIEKNTSSKPTETDKPSNWRGWGTPVESEKVRSAFCSIWTNIVKSKYGGVPAASSGSQAASLGSQAASSGSPDAANNHCEENGMEMDEETEVEIQSVSIVKVEECLSSDVDEDYKPKFKRKLTRKIKEEQSVESPQHLQIASLTKTQEERPSNSEPRLKYLKCNQCDLSFKLQVQLIHHNRKVHSLKMDEVKMIKCVQLEFEAPAQPSLDCPTLIKPKRYNCKECSKTFAYKESLDVHTTGIHEKEKPYRCKFCGDRFIRRSYLTRHVRIHTNERPYECSMCKFSFYRKDNLNSHVQRVHVGGGDSRQSLKFRIMNGEEGIKSSLVWFQCSVCKVFLETPDLVMEHVGKYHRMQSEDQSPLNNVDLSSKDNNSCIAEIVEAEKSDTTSLPAVCTKFVMRECSVSLANDLAKLRKNLKSKFLSIFTTVSNVESNNLPKINSMIKSASSSAKCNFQSSKNQTIIMLSDSEYVTDNEDGNSGSKSERSYKSPLPNNLSSHEGIQYEDPLSPPIEDHKSYLSENEDENIEIITEATILSSLSNSYSCETCGKIFQNETVFKRHCRLHKINEYLVCCLCNLVLPTQKELTEHYSNHKKNDSLKSSDIPNGIVSKPSASADAHSSPFQCPCCNREFSKQIGLSLHLKSHTVVELAKSAMNTNLKSNGRDGRETALAIANSTKFPIEPIEVLHTTSTENSIEDGLPCILCQLKFSSSNELIKHYRVHQEQEPTSMGSSTISAPAQISPSEKEYPSSTFIEPTPMPDETPTRKLRSQSSLMSSMKSNVTNSSSDADQEELFLINSYKCPACQDTFSMKHKRDSHVQQNHPNFIQPEEVDASMLECHICTMRFKLKRNLEKHIQNKHSDSNTLSRSIEASWDKNLVLGASQPNYHQIDPAVQHLESGEYRCAFLNCGRLFLTVHDAESHTLQAHDKCFSCSRCDANCGSKDSLEKHYRDNHETQLTESTSSPAFQLQSSSLVEENRDMDNRDGLNSFEVQKNALICPIIGCQKRFFSKRTALSHQYFHKKTYICPTCDKWVATHSCFTNHLKKCNPDALRNEADETAQYIRKLTSPSRTNISTDRNATSTTMHIDTASGTTSASVAFSCGICSQICSNRDVLLKHIAENHMTPMVNDSTKNNSNGSNPFSCPHCSLSFPLESTLAKHVQQHILRFNCQLCNRKYAYKYKLDSHVTNAHPEEAFKTFSVQEGTFIYSCPQSNCNERLYSKSQLELHMEQKHEGRSLSNGTLCSSTDPECYPDATNDQSSILGI